jgi:hypothetical protein
MQYIKKDEMEKITVAEATAPKTDEQKGSKVDTGPQEAERFPATDEWAGKPVTGDYQTIPEDKEAVEENLKTAGEEVQKRFGLETRGVDITVPNEPTKSEK